MFWCPMNILMVSVMSIHSLIGCSIDTIHYDCAHQHVGGQGAMSAHHHQEKSASAHEHDISTASAESQDSSDEKQDRQSPHSCKCNDCVCVFVHDAAEPQLIDARSLEPATSNLEVVCSSQVAVSHYSTAEHDFGAGNSLMPRCAMIQVWLL